jgi:hypothetical protein
MFMKRLVYLLSILVFFAAVGTIGVHLNFLVLVGIFFVIGVLVAFWGGERFALYFFIFLFPFINSSPVLMGSRLPYNYTAPALFLLCGVLIKVFGGAGTFFQKGPCPPEAYITL